METIPSPQDIAEQAAACYLSVVIPVFNEQDSLEPLHQQLKGVLSALGCTYEIIYIDDGSTDGSLLRLQKLAEQDRPSR